jgi:hypothetical protein
MNTYSPPVKPLLLIFTVSVLWYSSLSVTPTLKLVVGTLGIMGVGLSWLGRRKLSLKQA